MREHYRGRSVVGVIAALLATSLSLTCTTDPVEATGRECPRDLWGLLKEVYRSLDANNKQLPIGGAKTIIDMLMVDKVGDVGTFEEKLRKLEALGFISATNREVLAAALDVGHAAAHRGHIPEEHEVSAVMDIVENLLHAIYVLPKMAEHLKKTTTPRAGKKTIP